MEEVTRELRTNGLPVELAHVILHAQGSQYLEGLATASFDLRFTDELLPPSHHLLPELAQRWISRAQVGSLTDEITTLSCLARILPLATYLQPSVKRFLSTSRLGQEISDSVSPALIGHEYVQVLLVALFRLLSHDRTAFTGLVKPVFLCSFFSHEHLYIRYLAVECFCQVMGFADAFCQRLLKERHVTNDQVSGPWEQETINYRLLKLYEERRWKRLSQNLEACQKRYAIGDGLDRHKFAPVELSPLTVSIADVLVPRNEPSEPQPSLFIPLPTAQSNIRAVAVTLHRNTPTLLVGPGGAGKTAIVREIAHQVRALSTMITLHLNDQTDAKSLLGIYTSSDSGSGFTWQPGVLTKAVREGRWILIEDIDRAPAEVLGLLRPLIENNELLLSSRKETVRPSDGFRLFGTVRSSAGSTQIPGGRTTLLSNRRLWNIVEISSYSNEEVEMLLRARFSNLGPFLTNIIAAHTRIVQAYSCDSTFKDTQIRLPSVREVLKWCRRLSRKLQLVNSSLTTPSTIPETFVIDMLKDGMDCYAAHLTQDHLYQRLAEIMSESLNVAPAAAQHALTQQNPIVQQHKSAMQVGRALLPRLASKRSKRAGTSRFALTRRVRQNMEAIAVATAAQEPVLLVGETGVGKTTLLQHIASSIEQDFTVVNLSNQSEASDLLGGLKPVTTRSLLVPLIDEFDSLFDDTFSAKKNENFRQSVSKAFARQKWQRLIGHWEEAVQLAQKSLPVAIDSNKAEEQSAKRRKVDYQKYQVLRQRWLRFAEAINKAKAQVWRGEQNQVFAFVESRLVQAVRTGCWLLLDEINLASSETLDNLLSLLHHGDGEVPYLLLADAGNIERINAHPNFRVFAAMNPATDTGKKDLPLALRAHFTEIYVHAGDTDVSDLIEVIQVYLGSLLDNDKKAAKDLAKSYLALKQLNIQNKLTDGAGDLPHFSLRSLTRCLQYVQQHAASHGLRRAMIEGLQMSFFTVLDLKSQAITSPAIEQYFVASSQAKKALLSQRLKISFDSDKFVAFEHHLITKGSLPSEVQSHYITTKSVTRNLINLARASSMKRFPVLLQGPTSAGKTSMVEYLAKYSGNKFVRINNHEHTDLQEYLGNYASSASGKLEYQEGVLVQALRKGYWIVLDELNLAPSDVLEALNRLLDDNRELLIPESQEIVRPHPNFMLFATQNPAGLYGGRKRLSRAFRNRFMEIHVDDIPEDELEFILKERAQIAPSFCKHIVDVYKSLSLQRQSSRLFEARNSFATLRDLFRWASRPVDDKKQLAYHGFMLLAERVRDPAEKQIVKNTIEEILKVKIDENKLYGIESLSTNVYANGNITWTRAMRRLFVLVSNALQNNEPVLLVGETGCGKTQVCQSIAFASGKPLNIYNAHSNTETGDLIGSQRPIRHKSELAQSILHDFSILNGQHDASQTDDVLGIEHLITQFKAMDTSAFDQERIAKIRQDIAAYQSLFIWSDGSLVRAMKEGSHFLLDEISLADDSVLERMNSLLEPARTVLLAEKGAEDNLVVAQPGFQFLATMNPGGDYGKRELSAALRNRLTEIWVPALSDDEDIVPILEPRLHGADQNLARQMVQFAHFFRKEIQQADSETLPLRTLLTWADFISRNISLGIEKAVVHGAAMTFIDSLGANPAGLSSSTADEVVTLRSKCLAKLSQLLQTDAQAIYDTHWSLEFGQDILSIGSFSIPRLHTAAEENDLVLEAPTTLKNGMRIVRALQTNRPLLLEGNPGVGKTAIVSSLARLCGRHLTRVNLSDQTDLMDLFGADAPAADEAFGSFVWRDGPLLTAMQSGGWVLLDEMNLASQSVLEGLNACLDHRQEVYIAELDKTFRCHPDFKLFATQNPHHQGGGRKGLPASFVNRFTVVYADPFTKDDLIYICTLKYPSLPKDVVDRVVTTVDSAQGLIQKGHEFADGGPWELNLRDLHRWLNLCIKDNFLDASAHFGTILGQRFRNTRAREQLAELCRETLGSVDAVSLYHNISEKGLQVGVAFLPRDSLMQPTDEGHFIHTTRLSAAQSIMTALDQRWPVILAGPADSGKTSLIRSLASLSGFRIVEFSMNADVDAADLVGGYEQYETYRDIKVIQEQVLYELKELISRNSATLDRNQLYALLSSYGRLRDTEVDAVDFVKTVRLTVQNPAIATSPEITKLTDQLQKLQAASEISLTKFVWNDGVLIDALKTGSWLVLDNANLCNPSVLDRLNSLLEPDGSLLVSEQHGSEGSSRLVRPHPNFRIFMTMDPRHGELSRAMRNRSLEVYLEGQIEGVGDIKLPQYPSESAIARLRSLDTDTKAIFESPVSLEPWMNNLTQHELALAQPDHRLARYEHIALEVAVRLNPILANLDAHSLSNTGLLASTRDTIVYEEPTAVSLINEPMVQLYTTPDLRTHLLEVHQWKHAIMILLRHQEFLKTIAEKVQTKHANHLTWLERTTPFMLNQIRRGQGLHIAAFPFVQALQQFSLEYADAVWQRREWQNSLEVLGSLTSLATDFIELFHRSDISESRIRPYLQVAVHVQEKISTLLPHSMRKLEQVIGLLGNAADLQQFQNLQRMWPLWKGQHASSKAQLETRTRMQALLQHFNEICQTSPLSRAHLAQVRIRLVDAYESTIANANSLVQLRELENAVAELAIQSNNQVQQLGHFANVFNAILRKGLLKGFVLSPVENHKWGLFGDIAALESTSTLSNSLVVVALSQLSAISSAEPDTYSSTSVAPGDLAFRDILRQLSTVQDQEIGHMNHAVEELSELARAFSRGGLALTTDSLGDIRRNCLQLLDQTLKAYDVAYEPGGIASSIPDVLQHVHSGPLLSRSGTEVRRNLTKVFSLFGERPDYENYGKGLFILTSTILALLITEKAYDPAEYFMLVRELHLRRLDEATSRIASWKYFQSQYCGQDTSLIIRKLEADFQSLGDAPEAPPVYRPADPKYLEQISIEFVNVQRNILSDSKMMGEILGGDRSVRSLSSQNFLRKVSNCVKRLSNMHRAYNDLTQPVIGLLHAMALAVRMLLFSSRSQVHQSSEDVNGFPNVEFEQSVNSHPRSIISIIEKMDLSHVHVQSLSTPQIWHYLRYLKLQIIVGQQEGKARARSIAQVVELVARPYITWTQQVDKDREEAESNSKYYAYRGGDNVDEVNEADVKAEFPSFEDDEREQISDRPTLDGDVDNEIGSDPMDVKRSAIDLSRYHRSIFMQQDPTEILRSFLIDNKLVKIASDKQSQEDETFTPERLPGFLLAVQDKLDMFTSTQNQAINVYADCDMNETRKLFAIVGSAQARFVEIGNAWPDHAVPVEVFAFCGEVMALKMSDPIAKLLTKSEKLLQIISQWQVVASREWSVADIMESLTNLIIRWRRLELGSWSRLLDVEDQKMQDDTDAWYFIAYGAIIHRTLAAVEGVNGDGHAETWSSFRRELAKTLEEFLTGTTVGQFSRRLELMRIFACTLDAVAEDRLDHDALVSRRAHQNVHSHQMNGEAHNTSSDRPDAIAGALDHSNEAEFMMATYSQSTDDQKFENQKFETLQGQGRQIQDIRDVIQNVVQHHLRYEPEIRKTLTDGRTALEKAITEQIKLASWKDTNITALKESARRSHFKLFKIVKKYRALLSQPITALTSTYSPKSIEPTNISIESISSPPDIVRHVEECSQVVPTWHARPERLRNPAGAINTMRHVYTALLPDFSPHSELASYLEDITNSALELRKATPSILNDENSALIGSLKQRKRKLLADTMKEVSQMGVRRNLGTNELILQSSSAQILAKLPAKPATSDSVQLSDGDEAFYELLDVLPSAREAAIKHSEELTGGEVARGLGYLEGMSALVIKQRTQLMEFSGQLRGYDKASNSLNSLLHAFDTSSICIAALESDDNYQPSLIQRLVWAPPALEVYSRILDFQQRQGASSSFGEFAKVLREQCLEIQEQLRRLSSLPSLPAGLSTHQRRDNTQDASRTLTKMNSTASSYMARETELRPVATQVQSLASANVEPDGAVGPSSRVPLTFVDKQVVDVLNTIFVALQQATEALRALPSSVEDREWLVRSANAFGKATVSLHVELIAESFETLLASLQYVNASELYNVLSLLVVASPIILQFGAICHDIEQRLAAIQLHTCRLAVYLGKTFTTLAKEGFCSPSEASRDQDQSGKVEQGTGLGEGDAAEDISKDVADDEDLSELAQQAGEKGDGKDDMEKSKDAVDMGADDLEGEMGSGDEEASDNEDGQSNSDDEDGQDMDEETGSVDDLDPNAVDEKMWDDMQKEAEKEQKEMKSQKSQGQKTDDDAAKGDNEEQNAGDEIEANEEDTEGDDDANEEGQQKAEGENIDPHIQDEQALELPDDMQLNGEEEKEDNISDADMDDLSDVEDTARLEDTQEVDALPDEDKLDRDTDAQDDDVVNQDEEQSSNGKAENDEIMDDQIDDEDNAQDNLRDTREDNEMGDMQDQENGEAGMANTNRPDLAEKDESVIQGQNETEDVAQESEPQKGKQSSSQQQEGQNEGALEQGTGRQDESYKKQNDALKKLADMLEKYHQRREIFTASEDRQQEQTEQDVDMADIDFEHAGDGADNADQQALGTSNQEVSQNIDRDQAIEDSTADAADDLPMPEDAEKSIAPEQETVVEKFNRLQDERDKDDLTPHARDAVVPQSAHERPRKEIDNDVDMLREEDVEDVTREADVEIDPNQSLTIRSNTTSLTDAQHLWSLTTNKTQSLSLMLTEQLRLILHPTTATKLRGDFRTGKRLNIRRIIPYIASGYKRDKIWMRRSVPSKRNYQVMLAVDDSKSMAESGADVLALETLCMLSRSLSMLEVGELCIVAFGSDYRTTNGTTNGTNLGANHYNPHDAIKVAHAFSTPFSPSHSGPRTFQNFTFNQTGTNIRSLLSSSLHLFRDARTKSSAREAADLWQLQIIISDGHIGSDTDDSVRRLVRKAREEKIVCVFVVVDSGKESIVDLREVIFEEEQKQPDVTSMNGSRSVEGSGGAPSFKTRRYLENFPFQYYVVVRDVKDLPGVLARVLKGWFEGVVEMG